MWVGVGEGAEGGHGGAGLVISFGGERWGRGEGSWTRNCKFHQCSFKMPRNDNYWNACFGEQGHIFVVLLPAPFSILLPAGT